MAKRIKKIYLKPSGSSTEYYNVVKTVNTINYRVGQEMTAREVQRLIDGGGYEITVSNHGY